MVHSPGGLSVRVWSGILHLPGRRSGMRCAPSRQERQYVMVAIAGDPARAVTVADHTSVVRV
ncbi:hypothetical protein ACGF3J_24775 [Streptomyces sp. NPDC048171]|uniref:hypothetical protein n=1 Tax=Streptomyces sp. NPDC048171 TaxID=3365504 RepID=UPI00372319D8